MKGMPAKVIRALPKGALRKAWREFLHALPPMYRRSIASFQPCMIDLLKNRETRNGAGAVAATRCRATPPQRGKPENYSRMACALVKFSRIPFARE